MSEPSNGHNGAASSSPAPTPAPQRRRGGCIARFFAALLVVVITTFIALVAVASGLLYLGFTPDMPQRFADAQLQVGTLQAQNGILQTEVAAQTQLGGDDRETLSTLEQQLSKLDELQKQLRAERETALAQNATTAAEAQTSTGLLTTYSTAEASRAALLQQLDQRSARVERFLQRLGDISNDAALDLSAVPVASPGSTITPPTVEPTPSVEASTPTPAQRTQTPTITLGR